MTEAKFQTAFSRWASHNLNKTVVCELKLTKDKSIPFNALAPHQLGALKRATIGCVRHKISDSGFDQKPFDHFTICHSPAYVVIMFYRHGQKEFFMIPVGIWEKEELTSKRKSLTEGRAREIGVSCYLS